VPRAIHIADYQQEGESNTFCLKFVFSHYFTPLVVPLSTCYYTAPVALLLAT
jgi:hypothetical protein